MRILLLHEVGYLEKPIFEMHEFPEHLAARGHEIAFADYPETPIHQTASRFGVVVQGRVLSGASLRLYSQKAVLPGIVGRLLAVFLFPFFFHRVLRNFKPDIVVSYAVPTSGWQAAIICRARGKPLLFRSLDVSHRIRKTLFAPVVKVAEFIVYSTASHVSCNNPALLRYCSSLGAETQHLSVESPPLDLPHFLGSSNKRSQLRDELGIGQQERVLLYMGSFFYFSGLDHVIRGLSKLVNKPHLVLIGGGEKESDLRALVADLGLSETVTFTGFVDFAALPEYLSIADVAINPMAPSLVSNAALPNKVLQYMACGLPVVSTMLEGLQSIFPDQPAIKYVQNPEKVLGAALDLLDSKDIIRLGQSNREAISAKFGIEDSVDKFERLLSRVGRRF